MGVIETRGQILNERRRINAMSPMFVSYIILYNNTYTNISIDLTQINII